jgi:UDP-N-acetylmuramate--alanine ligase
MESVAGKKYHFVGIGGIGTSGLAKVLIKQGATVSGSDMGDGPVLQDLANRGATIAIGHRAENMPDDADAVIISAAIPATNPELTRAGEKGKKIYKYAAMLGNVFDQFAGIAVCGTHGKSTTSAWTAMCWNRQVLTPVLSSERTSPNLAAPAELAQAIGSLTKHANMTGVS